VVLIAEELSPATVDALGPDFEVRHVDGTDRAALLAAVPDAEALLVRSATKVDGEVLAAAGRLRVVARAGVGLDNVDVGAASHAGVMVVNAPTSNIVSAAELSIALLLASVRRVTEASASVKQGRWERSRFVGTELFEKTVGIVGLGRVGVLVADRLRAFGMHVIAYDPYVSGARAAQHGVRMVNLDELLSGSDVISVHLPRTPETVGLIDERALAKVRDGVHIINAARGGIVDEMALAQAIRSGRVAGAGIDVFAQEPPQSSPLLDLPQVVATPHLGASTAQAQERAGLAVAASVRRALAGELVPDAVNVSGGAIDEEVRPGIPLAERLGEVFTALAQAVPVQLDVEVRGEITGQDVSVLRLAVLKGVFSGVVPEQVTYVNAPLVAADRGVDVRMLTEPESPDYRNVLTVRGTLSSGETVSVSGTLTGAKLVQKLIGIDDFELEMPLADYMLVLRYADRPGVVGALGQLLGKADVNIAGMQVSRDEAGGHALGVLALDSGVPSHLVDEIADVIGASQARAIDLG
jgi:D-3-phosphoglycerate dehydrogenase